MQKCIRITEEHIAHSCKVFGSGAKKGEESFTAGVSSPQVIITQYTFEIFCSGYVFFLFFRWSIMLNG